MECRRMFKLFKLGNELNHMLKTYLSKYTKLILCADFQQFIKGIIINSETEIFYTIQAILSKMKFKKMYFV